MKRLLIPLMVAAVGAIGIILFMRKRAEATQALPSYAPPSFVPPKEPILPGEPTQYAPPRKPIPPKRMPPKVKPKPAIKPTVAGIALFEKMFGRKFYGGAQDLFLLKNLNVRPLAIPAFRIETMADFVSSVYVHGAAKKALRLGKITANYILPILKSKKVYSIKSDPLGSKIIVSEKLPPREIKLTK